MDEDIVKALKKRAKGYKYNEVQEEYSVDENGKVELTKRKVYEKYCPPDSAALKAYMELMGDTDLSKLSDEELEAERARLLREFGASELAAKANEKTKTGGVKSTTSVVDAKKRSANSKA